MIKKRLNGLYEGTDGSNKGLTLKCVKVVGNNYRMKCVKMGCSTAWYVGEEHDTVEHLDSDYWRDISFQLYLKQLL